MSRNDNIENVKGTCLYEGLNAYNSADVDTIKTLYISNRYWANAGKKFNASDEEKLNEYTRKNGFGIVIGDLEWPNFADIEISNMLYGIHFKEGYRYTFSGIYETTFTLSDEMVGKEGEIDLGDVHFVASVYLNDQFLGAALMPPYSLKIPEGVLNKNNTLKEIVTNTSANWYLHTDYFDKWKTEELFPYFDGKRILEKTLYQVVFTGLL